MAGRSTGGKLLMIGSILALSVPFGHTAHAASSRHPATHSYHGTAHASQAKAHGTKSVHHVASRKGRLHARRWTGIQCVTFARSESGIELSGNAYQWWDNA